MLGFAAVPMSELDRGVRAVLSNWLPFLFYAVFAAAIPATMIAASFILPGRPVSRTRQRMLPFESGVSEGAPSREKRFTVSFYLTAILFILSRLLHAFGMDRPGANWMRVAGISVSWLVLLGLGAYAIFIAYQSPPIQRGFEIGPGRTVSAPASKG